MNGEEPGRYVTKEELLGAARSAPPQPEGARKVLQRRTARAFSRVGRGSRDLASLRVGGKAATARCRCGALVAELWSGFGEWVPVPERKCVHDGPLPSPAQTAQLLRRHAGNGKTARVVIPMR